MRFFISLSLAILMLAPINAMAQAPENLRHPELQKFAGDGGTVEFLGNAYGLDGWLLTKESEPARTVYTTPEGGLVMGMLVNPDGTIETKTQLEAFKNKMTGGQESLPGAEKSEISKSEKFYAEVEKAAWVKAGSDNAPYIYMFMNVGCNHCQDFWKDLKPQVDAGKLQVRLVPFGRSEINRVGGAALLTVDNPVKMWDAFIAGNKAVLTDAQASDKGYKQMQANDALLTRWKIRGMPPYTVYRKVSDGEVTVIIERPKNLMLLFADLIK